MHQEDARADGSERPALRRELGLADLVLMQVLFVIGSSWVGTAAKLGAQQVVYWLLAIALFYLPQAAVVIWLNARLPLEGGLYQWAKVGLGEFWGFLVAWNLWVYTIVILSAYSLGIATTLAYALPHGDALATSKSYDAIVTVALVAAMMLVAILGLRVGKWVHNLGGLTQLLAFAALIAAPLVARARGTLPHDQPVTFALPAASLFGLNILSKMGMGALSGFEWVAILAGESRHPARSIGRSVLLAAPLIALMFIFGTSAVLAFVQGDRIDLISPIPQTLSLGYRSFGFASAIAPSLVLLLFVRQIAAANLNFTGNTRLPMVAGWDGLLPGWFTRLHPRYRTPVNSIVFVGAVTLVLGLAGLVGVGQQEAFQMLDNAAGTFYALAYLVMFALPLLAADRFGARAPRWLRAAALSGFAMTALYVVLATVPIVDVVSRWAFAAKMVLVIAVANAIGIAIYALRTSASRAPSVPLPADRPASDASGSVP
jgi:amino acid transporter